jgi:hypothetical protein
MCRDEKLNNLFYMDQLGKSDYKEISFKNKGKENLEKILFYHIYDE